MIQSRESIYIYCYSIIDAFVRTSRLPFFFIFSYISLPMQSHFYFDKK